MFQTYLRQLQIMDTVVPIPKDTAEVYLLLEATHANHQVHLTQRELALQIVHRNTLTLQYNCMLLDKAQEDLHTADCFISHVRFVIRKNGIPVAFEYAMHEDYSLYHGMYVMTFLKRGSTNYFEW